MLPYNALRARPNLNDPYGYYNNNPYITSGRGSGRTSPLSLGGRLGALAGMGGLGPISGGLINPLALNPVGIGGLPPLGGGYNGISPLALNGVGTNALIGGAGLLGRGRMSPILSGAANPPYGNALAALPRSAGFSPNTLPSLARQRGRGLLGTNAQQNHYVYPPAEQHFSIPLFTTSLTAQLTRQNGLLGRMNDGNPTLLTIPVGATVNDIFDELHKVKYQYDYNSVWIVTRNMEEGLLVDYLDMDAEILLQLDVYAIYVIDP